jgi:hypothetical protein
MADGRSRKAAATKKAAAAKSEARAARPRKVVDAANVQPKMGIAHYKPGYGSISEAVLKTIRRVPPVPRQDSQMLKNLLQAGYGKETASGVAKTGGRAAKAAATKKKK